MIQQWIDRNENWAIGVVTLAALLYAWPNLVHEPLHWLGLKLFGGQGHIVFNWVTWPAQPYHVHEFIPSITAGLVYRILPSAVSVGILSLLWITRKQAALLTHIVLPLYLAFDLVTNIMGQSAVGNDFHFLTVMNPLFTYVPLVAILILGYKVIVAGVEDEVKEYQKKRLLEVIA